MLLAKLFPDCNVEVVPSMEFPEQWNSLLSSGNVAARRAVADLVNLGEYSEARTLLMRGSEVGVLIPKSKKRKKNPLSFRLAILLNVDTAMLFRRVHAEYVIPKDDYPRVYLRLIRELGALAFSQADDGVIPPHEIHELAANLFDDNGCTVALRPF